MERAEDYPCSSYHSHALGVADALIDPLIAYRELSPYAKVRQKNWAAIVRRPLEEARLAAIRRSSATGLPYGSEAWVKRLAKKLDLDLAIRPRGRDQVNPSKLGLMS